MANNNYYITHRYTIRQKAFIKKAYSRKDTEKYYLNVAKQLEPFVRKEQLAIERARHPKKKVIKELPQKKRKSKKVIKYKIIDIDDDCDNGILRFD
jgi:hypothetical protein